MKLVNFTIIFFSLYSKIQNNKLSYNAHTCKTFSFYVSMYNNNISKDALYGSSKCTIRIEAALECKKKLVTLIIDWTNTEDCNSHKMKEIEELYRPIYCIYFERLVKQRKINTRVEKVKSEQRKGKADKKSVS